jgi:hypothetical protein
MKSITRRLTDLETRLQPGEPVKVGIFDQDPDDPTTFTDADGNRFTESEIDALEGYRLKIIVQRPQHMALLNTYYDK